MATHCVSNLTFKNTYLTGYSSNDSSSIKPLAISQCSIKSETWFSLNHTFDGRLASVVVKWVPVATVPPGSGPRNQLCSWRRFQKVNHRCSAPPVWGLRRGQTEPRDKDHNKIPIGLSLTGSRAAQHLLRWVILFFLQSAPVRTIFRWADPSCRSRFILIGWKRRRFG